MPTLSFRHWLRHKWYEHCAELEGYGQPLTYNLGEYFARYKYWLRREYRHQQGAK